MNKIVPALLTLSVLSMMTVGILISTKYMAEAPSLDNRSSAAARTPKPSPKCSDYDKKNKNSSCYEGPAATPKPTPNKQLCEKGLYCTANHVEAYGSSPCIDPGNNEKIFCCPKNQKLYEVDGVNFRQTCR